MSRDVKREIDYIDTGQSHHDFSPSPDSDIEPMIM